jgi:DNA-binding MarR family transcriptional regulator
VSADIPKFDPVIHAPARLQIAALLCAVSDADFSTVRDTVGVSDSVLSKHLKQLEDAGYVRLSKASLDGRVRTRLAMTKAGRRAFAAHVKALQALVSVAEHAPTLGQLATEPDLAVSEPETVI